jgi:MFS family permease
MLLIRRRSTAVGLLSSPANVLGALAIAAAAAIAIGPAIGGLLVGWFSWRAAFWINVPVSVAALVMALLGVYVIPCGDHTLSGTAAERHRRHGKPCLETRKIISGIAELSR